MATSRSEDRAVTLEVKVSPFPGAEPEAISEASQQLRRELLELDVEAVEPARSGQAPAGSRGVDIAALGTLIVTAAHTGILGAVVSAVRSWLSLNAQRSIKLELDGDTLEMTGVSSEEQDRLAEAWLRRHTGR